MRIIFWFAIKLFFSLFSGAILFVALFQVIQSPSILLYRGFVIALITFLFLIFFEILLSKHKKLSEEILGRVFTSFSFNLVVLVLFPVTFERSVSVFLLREFELASSFGLTTEELRQKFNTGFVEGLSPVDRRIQEQVQSGNIVYQGKRLYLTKQGGSFLNFARAIMPFFSKDDALLMHKD